MSRKEGAKEQKLLLALADNLQDTMHQLISITELSSENSLRLKKVGGEIKDLTSEFVNILSHQMEINNYINSVVLDVNERVERLRENAMLLNEEGENG